MAPPATFPIFDLQKLEEALSATGHRAEEATAKLRRALQEEGLFYVTNIGADVERIAAGIRAVTEPVMDLPDDETAPIVAEGFPPSGLTRHEGESTARVTGKGDYSDLCAKWTYKNGDNILPPDADGSFVRIWVEAHEALDAIAIRLLRLVAQVLDLTDLPQWQDLVSEGKRDAMLRFLRYPDVPLERAADIGGQPERMAAHHDLDVITLLHQTPCPNGFCSLQGFLEGEWVDVPALAGSLVVNFGEVLSILSSGAVKATTHRVVCPSSDKLEGSSRQVLVMFWEPPADFRIKPLNDSLYGHHAHGSDGLPFGEWLGNCVRKLQAQNEDQSGESRVRSEVGDA